MDNGNTFHDVLNACFKCKIEDLDATIRNACGLKAEKNSLYGSFSVSGTGRTRLLCDMGMELDALEEFPGANKDLDGCTRHFYLKYQHHKCQHMPRSDSYHAAV